MSANHDAFDHRQRPNTQSEATQRPRNNTGRGRFAEMRAEEKNLRDVQERKAARTVAGYSTDATECAQLLQMLGLYPGQEIGEI